MDGVGKASVLFLGIGRTVKKRIPVSCTHLGIWYTVYKIPGVSV